MLLAPEGDDFWRVWNRNVHQELVRRNLISPEDVDLMFEASNAADAVACAICHAHGGRGYGGVGVGRRRRGGRLR